MDTASIESELTELLAHMVVRPAMFGSPTQVEGEIIVSVSILLSIRSGASVNDCFSSVHKQIREITMDVGHFPSQWIGLATETATPHERVTHERLGLKSRELCEITLGIDPDDIVSGVDKRRNKNGGAAHV